MNVCALALEGFEVYSVDVSGETLEIASRLVRKLGVKVYFKQVSGYKLPFGNDFFDAVPYVWTLHEMGEGMGRVVWVRLIGFLSLVVFSV